MGGLRNLIGGYIPLLFFLLYNYYGLIIIFNVRKLHQHLLEDDEGVFAVVLTTLTAKTLREYLEEYELKHPGELFRPKKFQMLVQGDGQFLRFITVTTAY